MQQKQKTQEKIEYERQAQNPKTLSAQKVFPGIVRQKEDAAQKRNPILWVSFMEIAAGICRFQDRQKHQDKNIWLHDYVETRPPWCNLSDTKSGRIRRSAQISSGVLQSRNGRLENRTPSRSNPATMGICPRAFSFAMRKNVSHNGFGYCARSQTCISCCTPLVVQMHLKRRLKIEHKEKVIMENGHPTYIMADDNTCIHTRKIHWVKKYKECLYICTQSRGCSAFTAHKICNKHTMDTMDKYLKRHTYVE